MKTLFFPLFCLLAFNLSGQNPKGAAPFASASGNANGTTRAVVIGISDYKEPGITDLKYAHRDAEAFVEYLQSKAGGSLNEDQIMLLTNEKATGGQMLGAFDWLIEVSEPGDRAIIYFSGHGDVETISRRQRGFLLPYDSPTTNYQIGAYALVFLQDVIDVLSIEKETQVIMISDACRAGQLAGNSIGGAKATSAEMAKQFSKEIKILSCQPDELSLEGEQWGGGRGAFSFHFVDGLYGLADNNEDQAVNLLELGRYLEDKVSSETAPQSQLPMTIGPKATPLAMVDKDLLALLKSKKEKGEPMFLPTGSRGLEDKVLATVDSTIREQYLAFKASLASGALMHPANTSANDLYIILSKEPDLAPLHSSMRRNLAAALLDESQKVVNNALQNDPAELAKIFGRGLYRHIPGYLERAAELLGESHYFFNRAKGLQYLFEAYNLLTNSPYPELVVLQKKEAIPLVNKALDLAGDGAFIYDFLGELYSPINTKSAAEFFYKSTELSPTYASPYNNMGMLYSLVRNPFLKVKYYKKAIETDPRYFPAYDNIGSVYSERGNYKKAEKWYNQSVEVFPNALAYSNLGSIYYEQGRYAEAAAMCLKGIETQPTFFRSYVVLANVYKASRQEEQLRDLLVTMEALAEARHGDYSEVALGYLHLNDETAFRSNYYKANARSEPLAPAFFYTVCRSYALQDNQKEALVWLELALSRGFYDRKKLRKDEALNSIRKEARFRALKREYRRNFRLTCKDCLWMDLKKKEG
ncbi:MAG: tetratricopeptide repeat protein [Bacteroidetes bacterium]|nr:MAG: tetratricopeptide repeat protein [Bacteroidota bacterium]